MADLNNAFIDAIKKQTGDDIGPPKVSSGGKDDELLKATLYFLTVVLKRVTGKSPKQKEETRYIPFVS